MPTSRRVDPNVFRRATILVAVGDRALRHALRDVLLGMGFPTIYLTSNQAETLRQISEREPSVILLDNSLPGGDGLGLTRRLRRHGGNHARKPIVLMAEAPDATLVTAARDAGVDEIVVRPVSMEALVVRLMHVLKSQRNFVRGGSFFGPDRRRMGERRQGERRDLPPGDLNPERRKRSSRRTGKDRRTRQPD